MEPSLNMAFKWTDEFTKTLIRTRAEKKEFFTGKRNAARSAWEVVLKAMGIEGLVTVKQVKKKWDNLLHRYKELKNARIGSSSEDITNNVWPFFQLMDEAFGGTPLVTLPVVIASIVDQNDMNYIGESSGTGLQSASHTDTNSILHSHLSFGNNDIGVDGPAKKKRKIQSTVNDDGYLELFQQSREDWMRMHTTMEKQGERMIALFSELVKSIKK